jgi:hypothetical protein
MKKILFLGFILTLFAISASAQAKDGDTFRHHKEMQAFHHREINRFEKKRLHRNEFRYRMARRRAYHDGFAGPVERRHLARMRMHERHELYRLHHNHRRLI